MVQFINVDMSLAFNSPCTEANFMPAAMSFMNRDEYTVNITFLMIFLVGGNPTGPYIIGDGGVVQNTEGMWTGNAAHLDWERAIVNISLRPGIW